MTLVGIGTGLVQLAQDWSNYTPLANWESIVIGITLAINCLFFGILSALTEFISRSGPRGNHQVASLQMNFIL